MRLDYGVTLFEYAGRYRAISAGISPDDVMLVGLEPDQMQLCLGLDELGLLSDQPHPLGDVRRDDTDRAFGPDLDVGLQPWAQLTDLPRSRPRRWRRSD